jgi:hypothetical protein
MTLTFGLLRNTVVGVLNLRTALAAAFTVSVLGTAFLPTLASAQAPTTLAADQLIGPPVPGAKPKTYALVSAVGSQLQIVRLKFGTGSNLEPYERTQLPMPNQALNNAVLRGLDGAVGRVDPSAKRVLLHVNIPTNDTLVQSERAQAATDKLMRLLGNMPERQQWDEIIAVTPRYMRASSNRMGTQLWGIGIYVQPLDAKRNDNSGLEDTELMGFDEETNTIGAESLSSTVFVAPYSYLRFTVLDAKTLKVIRTLDRTDYRKTTNPDCTDANLFKCFTPEQHSQMIETLTERTAARGIAGVNRGGSVEMKDVRVVPAASPASPASAPAR